MTWQVCEMLSDFLFLKAGSSTFFFSLSSNTEQTKKVKDPQAMITIFNRFTWRPKLWFLLQVNNSNIFLKEMCQKSKIDTTIDFVKITPNTQEFTFSWTVFVPKIWNRGIITLVVRMIGQDEKLKTKCLA